MQENKGYQQQSEKSEQTYYAASGSDNASCGDTFTTYVARYYVLTVFSLVAVHQNTTWMTFGTIPNESLEAFGLSDDAVTLLAAYGPIVFIPLTFPFMWFVEKAGLKITIVGSAWVLAIGCGIRCFVPSRTEHNPWIFLLHIGQMLNAAVGLPVMVAPPRLSSVWFPANQRVFATAAMMVAETLGISLSFIVIPYLTRTYDIHTMLYVQAEIGLFIAILATIYFPNQPTNAPSQTAATERINFYDSMKQLMRNRSFLMLAISGGLIQGAVGGFSSVLSIILNPKDGGFSDTVHVTSVSGFFHSTSWLGAMSSLFSFIGGQFIGIIGYKLQKRFKITLFVLLTISIALGVWFAVSVYGYWGWTKSAYNIFATLCLIYFFTWGTTPIYYEACAEVTYPVPEGSSAGILAVLINVAALMFQVIGLCHIFSNEHPGKAKAMVWALAAIALLSLFPIFLYKEVHKRLDIDDETSKGRLGESDKTSDGIEQKDDKEHSYTIQGNIQILSN